MEDCSSSEEIGNQRREVRTHSRNSSFSIDRISSRSTKKTPKVSRDSCSSSNRKLPSSQLRRLSQHSTEAKRRRVRAVKRKIRYLEMTMMRRVMMKMEKRRVTRSRKGSCHSQRSRPPSQYRNVMITAMRKRRKRSHLRRRIYQKDSTAMSRKRRKKTNLNLSRSPKRVAKTIRVKKRRKRRRSILGSAIRRITITIGRSCLQTRNSRMKR